MLTYTTAPATVQQVLLKHYEPRRDPNVHVNNVLQRLMICRTAALGYHAYKCTDEECGQIKYQYSRHGGTGTGTVPIAEL